MVSEGSLLLQAAFGALVFVFLVIGLYGFRETDTAADYDVADRSASALLVTGTLVASYLSASTFIGFTGTTYQLGFGFAAIVLITGLGLTLLGVGFAGPLRSLGEVTLPDFLGRRYDSSTLQGLSGLMIFFIVTIYAGGAVIGLAEVTSNLLGTSYHTSVVVISTIIVVYTLLGGMTSVLHTDGLQLIIMFVAAILILPLAVAGVGWTNGISQLNSMNWFTWNGGGAITPTLLFDQTVIWLFGSVALPFLFNRPFVAESKEDAVKGIMLGVVAWFIIALAISLAVGFAATQVSLDNAERAYPFVALNMVPAAIGVIALLGIVAAGLSSADTQLITAAQTIYRDLYQKTLSNDLDDDSSIKFARVIVLVLGLAIFVLAYFRPGQIFFIVAFAVGWSATSFFPAIAGGVYWDKGTANGAIASAVVGFVLLPIFQVTGVQIPVLLSQTFVTLLVGTIVYVGVSLVDSSTPSDDALEAYERLKEGRLYLKNVY